MKMYSIILFVALALMGCSSNSNSQHSADNPETDIELAATTDANLSETKVISEPIMLNKKMFLEKVWDYENSPQEWVYKGELPAIIDFYADWCRPCRIAAPILDELANEYKGKIIVYKIDTEVEQELAAVFGITGIPAFLYIPKNSQPVMASGIANSIDDTKIMFKKNIEDILLTK